MTRRLASVELQGVSYSFGASAALAGVCARFPAGTVTVVRGKNGAGKSTLLAILSTLLRPSTGSVVYAPLGQNRAEARAVIGWLGHEVHCYLDLSGRENVEIAAQLYGVSSLGAVSAICERVGAVDFLDQAVGTLSRGQRQRIALARALVHQPALLLLDEPLSGLDQKGAECVAAIVREEAAAGNIVVLVSHDDDWAQQVGDRTLVLDAGRVVETSEVSRTTQ